MSVAAVSAVKADKLEKTVIQTEEVSVKKEEPGTKAAQEAIAKTTETVKEAAKKAEGWVAAKMNGRLDHITKFLFNVDSLAINAEDGFLKTAGKMILATLAILVLEPVALLVDGLKKVKNWACGDSCSKTDEKKDEKKTDEKKTEEVKKTETSTEVNKSTEVVNEKDKKSA